MRRARRALWVGVFAASLSAVFGASSASPAGARAPRLTVTIDTEHAWHSGPLPRELGPEMLHTRLVELRACYRTYLEGGGRREGREVLRVRVGPDGTVVEVVFATDPLDDEAHRACVTTAVEALRFSVAPRSTVFRLPLELERRAGRGSRRAPARPARLVVDGQEVSAEGPLAAWRGRLRAQRAHLGFMRCYERLVLARRPLSSRRFVLRLRIGADGAVLDAEVEDPPPDRRLSGAASCIAARAARLRFDLPEGTTEESTLSLPLRLGPRPR